MKLFSELVIRWRWPIIVLFLAFTAVFAAQLPRLEIDPEIKNQLPEDMPARKNLRAIEDKFGGSELLMVVLEAPDVLASDTLARVQRISEGLGKVDSVSRVVSPFTLNDIRGSADGLMSVEPAVAAIPANDVDREALRARLRSNDLVFGNVLARDFTAVSIIAFLKTDSKDAETLAAVEAVVAGAPGSEKVQIGGMPVVRVHVSEDIRSDVRRFAPFGILIIVAILYLSLREIRGVILPFAVMIMTVIFSVGLAPVLGWKFQMMMVTLPVTILAIGNDHSVHLVARFQEDNVPGNQLSAMQITKHGLRDMGIPVLAAGITTVAGMLCQLTHIVVPAQQLGWLSGIGLGFAMLASLTFVPAVMSLLPKPTPLVGASSVEEGGLLERWLGWNARFVSRWPRAVIGGVLAFALVAASGIPLMTVDTNPVNYYPSDAPVAQTANLINQHFGGSTEIAVMIEGDIQDPVVLGKIDALERRLRDHPHVGYTLSIADVVRKMNRAVSGDTAAADKVPDNRPAIAQLFLLYSMGGSPEDFERMVDFDYRHAVVTARVNSLSTGDIASVVAEIRDEIDQNFDGIPVTVGGFGSVFADLVDAVVQGQVSSLLLSLLVVAVVDGLCFGSLTAGLWSIVPLVIGIPMLFGLMGFAGIELNVVTAMLSSIMVGVGVDYTTHFMFRYRDERNAGHNPEEAVYRTLVTSGRGIVFNALAVMAGFSVLFMSNFLPVRFFGFLVVVSIGGCLLAALVLMPPLMLVARPRYAEPKPLKP
jgi:uncharacterized protein